MWVCYYLLEFLLTVCVVVYLLFSSKMLSLKKKQSSLVTYTHLLSDAAVPYQGRLQESASATMEGLFLFNQELLVVIISIVLLVGWLLYATLETTLEMVQYSSNSDFSHSNDLEIGWTSVPALILLTLSSPSFSLLFSMDEVSEPDLTIKVFGHQWYWSYEMSDFNSCLTVQNLRYTSYMMDKEILLEVKGMFRNLETSRRTLIPTNTHLRLLVTSFDVLHSWAIPSLGVKIDACPGRLNLISLFVKRAGLFFGQCSEICGVNHGFMPIAVAALPSKKFYFMLTKSE